MKKLTAQRIINEMMKVPAVRNFYRRSDHQLITKLALICNHSIDIEDNDSIEAALATWIALGMFERVDDDAVNKVMEQADKDFRVNYMRFKMAQELLVHKALASLKKHIVEYRESQDMKEKLMHSAQIFTIYLSIMLSSRFFTIYSAQ